MLDQPPAAIRSQISGERFEIAGVGFISSLSHPSTAELFSICKNPAHVDRYREVLRDLPHPRIVELGIAQGGSLAMLSLLAEPEKLVAVDLSPEPVQTLSAFLAARDLTERVRLHYGVDQADRLRLAAILDEELAGAPLDLVIDDASHLYGPTRASFEVLFPRLRPGGIYLIEDWSWHHIVAETVAAILEDPSAPGHAAVKERHAQVEAEGAPPDPALSRIGVELMLVLALPGDSVADVSINENWILVRRGNAVLDPESFRLDDLYTDRLHLLGH